MNIQEKLRHVMEKHTRKPVKRPDIQIVREIIGKAHCDFVEWRNKLGEINSFKKKQIEEDLSRSIFISIKENILELLKTGCSKQECPICYEYNHILLLSCAHYVCFECLDKMEKKDCPMCRVKMTTNTKNENMILKLRKSAQVDWNDLLNI